MECKNFKNNILNFYYHECNTKISGEMQEHVSACSECAELFRQVSLVLGSTDPVKEVKPDSFYYTRLSSKINVQPESHVYTRFFVRLAQPLLAACFAVFGIFIGYKIVDGLQNNNSMVSKSDQVEVAELQLAEEYFPHSANEENIETYYLNE